jgi:hypothetical protein
MKALVLAVALAACSHGAKAQRYPVPADVGTLVTDDAAFAAFATPLRARVEAELAKAPADKDRRFVLAMLDALDDHWPEAVRELDTIRAHEPDPRKAAMTGFSIRTWAYARDHGGNTPEAFRGALEHAFEDTAFITLVKPDLAIMRAMGQTFTPATCRTLVEGSVHPVDGTVAFDDVSAIVFQRYAATQLARVGPVIDIVLGAHGIASPE